ncbi:uncharacterized protein LOC114828074 [Galendromus occidentalis]|uniref:Uncharacterized protein LOC114828074 n=1 Tax=Galendromus occidentalis TaxID=34638 RepID=A0AAJ7SEI0_9ACAR|nr:uncharacterized protein LOC114828074 [Galendromus occidentalis]
MQQTVSYRWDLRQAGTARGGRHSLVVSSALARELERDIQESRRKSHLGGSELSAAKLCHPALYRSQEKILNFVHSPLTSVEMFIRELDQYAPPKKRRSTISAEPTQLKFLFRTRY